MTINDGYDVVIIGAGIGGLVCGCYLAKEGLKVLIVEQQVRAGGYCSSFQRGGYSFDVAVHHLGSINNGIFWKILNELHLSEIIEFERFDPIDRLIMPDFEINIRANFHDTINEFKEKFSSQKRNIENFFKYIFKADFIAVYTKIKKLVFKELLDEFFDDDKLKATLNVLLANIGISQDRVSALAAVVLLRTYISDQGYSPKFGMQAMSDNFVSMFKKSGGDILFSSKVEQIITEDGAIVGVSLNNGKKICCLNVVSNADATETFSHLLDSKSKESGLVDDLTPSPSAFVVYLGLDNGLRHLSGWPDSIWQCSTYDIGSQLLTNENDILAGRSPLILFNFQTLRNNMERSPANKQVIKIIVFAPYISKEFWNDNNIFLDDKLISALETLIGPIKKFIKEKIVATPATFCEYTSNRNGAAFGWAATVSQINPAIIPQKTSITGLYLAGHWCTGGMGQSGVPGVALSGRKAAELILRKFKINWRYGMIQI